MHILIHIFHFYAVEDAETHENGTQPENKHESEHEVKIHAGGPQEIK